MEIMNLKIANGLPQRRMQETKGTIKFSHLTAKAIVYQNGLNYWASATPQSGKDFGVVGVWKGRCHEQMDARHKEEPLCRLFPRIVVHLQRASLYLHAGDEPATQADEGRVTGLDPHDGPEQAKNEPAEPGTTNRPTNDQLSSVD